MRIKSIEIHEEDATPLLPRGKMQVAATSASEIMDLCAFDHFSFATKKKDPARSIVMDSERGVRSIVRLFMDVYLSDVNDPAVRIIPPMASDALVATSVFGMIVTLTSSRNPRTGKKLSTKKIHRVLRAIADGQYDCITRSAGQIAVALVDGVAYTVRVVPVFRDDAMRFSIGIVNDNVGKEPIDSDKSLVFFRKTDVGSIALDVLKENTEIAEFAKDLEDDETILIVQHSNPDFVANTNAHVSEAANRIRQITAEKSVVTLH